MRIEYMLTLADAKAAERAHINQKAARGIGYGLLYLGVPILAVLGMIGFYMFHIGADRDLSLGYSIIEVMLISQAIFIPVERSKRLRKFTGAKSSKSASGPTRSVEINDEKITVEIPGVAKTDFAWGAIVAEVQDANMALLYVNDKDFISIPIRALTPPKLTELNDLIARHVKKKG